MEIGKGIGFAEKKVSYSLANGTAAAPPDTTSSASSDNSAVRSSSSSLISVSRLLRRLPQSRSSPSSTSLSPSVRFSFSSDSPLFSNDLLGQLRSFISLLRQMANLHSHNCILSTIPHHRIFHSESNRSSSPSLLNGFFFDCYLMCLCCCSVDADEDLMMIGCCVFYDE